MPAEWEPHEATWLVWPESEDWPGKLEAVRWAYCEFIRQVIRSERVQLIVQSPASERRARQALTRAHVELDHVGFVISKTDRTWARDSLPSFVVDERRSQLGAVKFRFNGWARYDDHELDDQTGVLVATRTASTVWQPTVSIAGKKRRFVLEGGAIDVDGEGTVLTTKNCLLGSSCARNPGLGQREVERVLRDHLGVERVIWLPDGIAGDDTSGHVDDFARFVAPGRVVVASEPNPVDPNHAPLELARRVLERSRDARGRQLEVVPLPMPRAVHYDGERLPASYANFYLTNGAVLVPTFNDPNDRRALEILAAEFPGRDVVGIHALDLVVGLGTLHCSSQQQPKVG